MKSIEKNLEITIAELDDKLTELLKKLPSYTFIKNGVIKKSIENKKLKYQKPNIEHFKNFLIFIYENTFIYKRVDTDSNILLSAFTALILNNIEEEISFSLDSVKKSGYGLFLSESIYNINKSKQMLESTRYIEAVKYCNEAYFSYGKMSGHGIGAQEGFDIANEMLTSKARTTKQKQADKRREEILNLYYSFLEKNPKLSKNAASHKISKNINMTPESIRNHLRNL